jgi:hypothetical protein
MSARKDMQIASVLLSELGEVKYVENVDWLERLSHDIECPGISVSRKD